MEPPTALYGASGSTICPRHAWIWKSKTTKHIILFWLLDPVDVVIFKVARLVKRSVGTRGLQYYW